MPPQGAAAAPAGGDPFAALPRTLSLYIFGRVPAEDRLRCREVCCGWRDTLAEPGAWTHLRLVRVCSAALLHTAAARAGGKLQTLRLACAGDLGDDLLAVATANAAALQELHVRAASGDAMRDGLSRGAIAAIARAAPLLRILRADLRCDFTSDAHLPLRGAPPFQALRCAALAVSNCGDAAAVTALAADVTSHAWLASLTLEGLDLSAYGALSAVVVAAVSRRLTSLQLHGTRASPAPAPCFAYLLQHGAALTELASCGDNAAASCLLDAQAAALLGAALRANSTLTALTLSGVQLFRDAGAAAALLDGLMSHRSLATLDLSLNRAAPGQQPAVGAALGALVGANARALRTLRVSQCGLGDEGMGPLAAALPRNTHMATLDAYYNNMSYEFGRESLLPTVRGNAGVRALSASSYQREASQAEALVRARTPPTA
jgi:hypothetical protein